MQAAHSQPFLDEPSDPAIRDPVLDETLQRPVVDGIEESTDVALSALGTTLTEQTHDALERIDGLLAATGTDRTHLLTAQVLPADIRRIDEFNAVWDEWLDGTAPARTVAEAQLGSPDWAVELTVTAALA